MAKCPAKVENTLFNVHKYQLMKSEVFSDMFKMPKAEGDEPKEGSSPEYPIVMKGIPASDFASLLKVLYASLFSSNQPVPDAALLIPAFRLANMLNFSELRDYLLPLAEKDLSDVEKIVFAREFDIEDWLAPAHIRLCLREKPLSTVEAKKLQVDSVLFIMLMREKYRKPILQLEANVFYCNACIGMGTTNYATTCGGCGEHGGDRRKYTGTGRMEKSGISSKGMTSIEVKVKEWVDNGCKLKM
ncbi:unnamed protein product [Rhizoctonia solani]|uniref:BTB domain-containing protein n=1 Tax=Rhizoctonia solani TaxID=456999 RepID=A0A8H3DWC9_9AGAM|nr:unnamed protein product [Rhizoctonia solani]